MVNVEKIQRSILFFVLNGLIIFQFLACKDYFNVQYTKLCMGISCGSFALASLYAMLCLCFRGYVKFTEQSTPFIELKERVCSFCRRLKPERSHHCKRCMRCIKKMDHHCYWLGACVNYYNHGHFVRFLMFTCIGSTFILIYDIYIIFMFFLYDDIKIRLLMLFYVIISFLVACVLAFVTSIHLLKQFGMILRNVTYIELLQKRNLDLLNKKCGESPYDIGWLHNIKEVFGPVKFLFCWMPNGDGVSFRKRWESEHWPSATQNIENAIYDSV